MVYVLLMLVLFGTGGAVMGQPHEIHYQKVDEIETDEVRIVIYDQHSQRSFTQFTARIFNKTDDYILIHRENVKFKFSWGEKQMMEAVLFIEPKGDITRTFKVQGGEDFWQDRLRVEFGEFYRVDKDALKTNAKNFSIPPEKKSLMDGPFSITALKWNASSKEAFAEFKIRYRGEGLGVVSNSNLKVILKDGTIFENQERGESPVYLTPNKMEIVRFVHKLGKGDPSAKDGLEVVFEHSLSESFPKPFLVAGVDFINK